MRKRVAAGELSRTKAPVTISQGANQRWSLDFVADTMTDGRASSSSRPHLLASAEGAAGGSRTDAALTEPILVAVCVNQIVQSG